MIFVFILCGIFIIPICIGIITSVIFGRKKEKKTTIGLLFHAISYKKAFHCSYFSPTKFEMLLSRLRGEGFQFTTVQQAIVNKTTAVDKYKKRSIVLTFDDGFESFYSHALPILERHNLKVTVFSVAGFLGKASSWDALPQQSHLSKSQLQEISNLGHEIGSHTLTHADCTLLSNKDLLHELTESKKILEDCIGKTVNSISFPFGRFTIRVWEAAKKAGYSRATSYATFSKHIEGIIPLSGVYAYDSIQDIYERAIQQPALSQAISRGTLMPHFAKGSPLWKFRPTYAIMR